MRNGSHSRHSYPLDKQVPRSELRRMVGHSEAKQVLKKMHKKKQRQRDRGLEHDRP
jgi:hypothetical protein